MPNSTPSRWPHRHLLDTDQLTRTEAELCLDRAEALAGTRGVELADRVIGLAFAEPSTRTRVSFEVAATARGALVVDLPFEASSATKGESLADTLRTLERTGVDTIVLRHRAAGAPYLAARSVDARILNAGDGAHAHPTQAMLDALTLRQALGGLNGKTVVIVGNVSHSRVARSNLHLLPVLGMSVRLSGPPAWIAPFAGWPSVEVVDDLDEALTDADAVMTLRVQFERQAGSGVPSAREYHRRWGLTSARMTRARPDAPVLHPGPTNEGVEITAELAASARSLIGTQVANGVAVRMAVMTLLAD